MLELNKIYNIDCLDGLKKIDDKSIDLIFTDPPYNIKYKNEGWDFRDDYLDFMKKVFVECDRVLKDTGSLYFFHNQFNTINKLQNIINDKTNLTNAGDIVLDLFSGSGMIPKVAKELK